MPLSLVCGPLSVVRGNTSKLYLASANPGKLREFREAARAHGVSVDPVSGIQTLPPCVEDGQTFEENVRKKAVYYSTGCEGLVFADDSGICVDALVGAPGIHSARFAGPHASDAANNLKLLEALRRQASVRTSTSKGFGSLTAGSRTAQYVCVIALAEGGRILTVTEGHADGVILEQPRGSDGFGYDPLFLYPPLGKTFAELSAKEKFTVSHRGQAFRKLLDFLSTDG